MENSSGKPYTIEDSYDNPLYVKERRVFYNFNPEHLFWHRDKEDRIVQLIEGEIEIQLDNELPSKLNEKQRIFIPHMTYHRVIAKGNFVVDVYKYKKSLILGDIK